MYTNIQLHFARSVSGYFRRDIYLKMLCVCGFFGVTKNTAAQVPSRGCNVWNDDPRGVARGKCLKVDRAKAHSVFPHHVFISVCQVCVNLYQHVEKWSINYILRVFENFISTHYIVFVIFSILVYTITIDKSLIFTEQC